jgi:CDGSH-type Zn-finger protein
MNKEVPIMKDLEPGTYYWCACGKTKTEPFCDGSHTEIDAQPVKFEIAEKKKQAALCNCQRTKNPPFCDGAHKEIERKVA